MRLRTSMRTNASGRPGCAPPGCRPGTRRRPGRLELPSRGQPSARPTPLSTHRHNTSDVRWSAAKAQAHERNERTPMPATCSYTYHSIHTHLVGFGLAPWDSSQAASSATRPTRLLIHTTIHTQSSRRQSRSPPQDTMLTHRYDIRPPRTLCGLCLAPLPEARPT
jgi:hypothetical protein